MTLRELKDIECKTCRPLVFVELGKFAKALGKAIDEAISKVRAGLNVIRLIARLTFGY